MLLTERAPPKDEADVGEAFPPRRVGAEKGDREVRPKGFETTLLPRVGWWWWFWKAEMEGEAGIWERLKAGMLPARPFLKGEGERWRFPPLTKEAEEGAGEAARE